MSCKLETVERFCNFCHCTYRYCSSLYRTGMLRHEQSATKRILLTCRPMYSKSSCVQILCYFFFFCFETVNMKVFHMRLGESLYGFYGRKFFLNFPILRWIGERVCRNFYNLHNTWNVDNSLVR